MQNKILLGMSGGVDSSVAALILKREGWSVTGVTLLLSPDDDGSASRDAAKLASEIGIEHITYDAKSLFREKIIGNFISEYLAGRTPNPCVLCNRVIKFGAMLDLAESMGIERIATGHYVVTENRGGKIYLKSNGTQKDQSYFLCMLSQRQLSSAVFPLAQHSKSEIRDIAESAGLSCAAKKDSQEVCFVANDDYASFIVKSTGKLPQKGSFVDKNGAVIGEHSGIINYTVGQRKGLGAFGKPMFVTNIDAEKNIVVLSEDGGQYESKLLVSNINLIYDNLPDKFEAQVKIRYRARPAAATVELVGDGRAVVSFSEPQRSVTPGQTAAFYDGEYVIGGGRIEKTLD